MSRYWSRVFSHFLQVGLSSEVTVDMLHEEASFDVEVE
jgi:hypothetical protein